MRDVLTITRMSSADAVALNEKVQATVSDCLATAGEQAVGSLVVEAAAQLGEATAPLSPTSEASFALRREVDTAADRCLGSLLNRCNDTIKAYEQDVLTLTDAQLAELAAAKWIKEKLLPEGVFWSGRWSEQFGITEMVLKNAAEPEAVERIAALGLDGTVALLTGIHEVYGERMGFTDLLPEDGDAPLFKWPFLPRWHAGVIYGTFTIWCHRFLNG